MLGKRHSERSEEIDTTASEILRSLGLPQDDNCYDSTHTARRHAVARSDGDGTAAFKPIEIQALQEVLDDYHAQNAAAGIARLRWRRKEQSSVSRTLLRRL